VTGYDVMRCRQMAAGPVDWYVLERARRRLSGARCGCAEAAPVGAGGPERPASGETHSGRGATPVPASCTTDTAAVLTTSGPRVPGRLDYRGE